MSDVKPPVLQMKDASLLLGWIAGLVFIAGLCWFSTQPLRNLFLLKAVNQVLEQSGDSRRLEETVSPGQIDSFGMGFWYTMKELPVRQTVVSPENSVRRDISKGTRAFVFAFIGEGTFFPCAAVVSPDGEVEEFIPLNSHGEKMMKRVSPGILKLYARRIAGAKS